MLKFSMRMIMFLAFSLAAFGIIIISYAGKSQGQDMLHYCMMQGIFFVMSLIVAAVLYHIDYGFYKRKEILWTLALGMIFALVLVKIPGIGKTVNGSQRWIALGPINVQPVEFVKILVVVFFSAYLDRLGGIVNRWWRGFLVPVGVIGAISLLLVLQPDFGGTMVVCFLAGLMLVMGGVKFWRCALLALVGGLAIATLIALNPNRMERLRNDSEGNYQADQSEIAFRNGGVTGVGLGEGMQKEWYLPECHTDFIFAVIGEDLGLIGTASIWLVFLLFLTGGSVIAFRAKDKQGMLLAFGATMVICAQGAANMAVVTHVFPTKGLALPFLSYGGSCLISTFASVGILLSVARSTLEAEENPEANAKRLVYWD